MARSMNNPISVNTQGDSGAALRSAPATTGWFSLPGATFCSRRRRDKMYCKWSAFGKYLAQKVRTADPTLHRNTSGTTTMEFALCIPFLLFISLLLIQSTLVSAGHLMVRYAAFTATRSAIVTIPADYADEPSNMIRYPYDPEANPLAFSGKYKTIRDAAVYAIAPATATDDSSADRGTYYPVNTWMDNSTRLKQKLQYAASRTYVEIFTTTVDSEIPPNPLNVPLDDYIAGGLAQVGPRDAITVRVTHDFKLTMPIVKAIFEGDKDGITELSAQFTLNNEGVTQLLPPIPTDKNPPSEQNARHRVPRLFGDKQN